MSTQSTNYKGFNLLSEDYFIKDPRSDKQSEFVLRIPRYEGVPVDSNTKTTSKRFCFLGDGYGGSYMGFDDIKSRLDVNIRRQDYELLRANSNASPLDVWNSSGLLIGIPSGLFVSIDGPFEIWDKEQYKRWVNVFTNIDNAKHGLPYNVLARFIQPAATEKIQLFFTPLPNAAIFDIGRLKTVFKATFNQKNPELPQYKYDVISWQEAEKGKLVLTGAHYLYFYFTWMKHDDFTNLWANLQKRPELKRPWPASDAMADKIDLVIHKNEKGHRGSKVTNATLTYSKASSAVGKRSNYKDQQTVMGASATVLAKAMWGEAALTGGRPADAEWLHRNAFRFGGTGDVVDLASSQTRENIVFGTGECNTHMIRAENAITALLQADALHAQDDSRWGTLVTTNIFKGKMWRMDPSKAGFGIVEAIPDWVDKQRYMWLCMGLKYEWEMNGTKLGSTFNVNTIFDPFSRYIPFRVEAHLDNALMNDLYNENVTMLSAPQVTSFALETTDIAPLIPMHQEHVLLWNAAKNNLPSVQVGSFTIFHPAIGDPPKKEPSSEPAVQVIGTDSLVSPLSKDVPAKATRIVKVAKTAQGQVSTPASKPNTVHPPIRSNPIPVTNPPDEGFITVGEIELFGHSSIRAKFEKWGGPPPSDVVILPGVPASVERASLTGDFHLSSIISHLHGTAYDHIIFRNVSVFHQNYRFEATIDVGWHFNADLVIDESCAGLRDLLSKALGVDEPTISIHAFLGRDGGWHKPPSLHSFTLEGVLSGIVFKPINGITLSKIGVRLFGIRSLKFDPAPRSVLEYGFSVFGTMAIDVPRSIVPLTLDYDIREYSGTVSLGATVNKWNNPLGIQGFTLMNTSISTSFALSSPWKSFVFDVTADFMYKDVRATFEGSYAPGGSFDINASIQNVQLNDIDTLFEWISNNNLSLPDVDLSISSAQISISSDKGLDISLDKVVIGDYTSVNAELTLTSHNVLLRGNLTSDVIEFGEIELKNAFLQLTLEGKGNGKQTDVILGGQVAFSSLTLDVAVHLYRSPDSSKKSLEWTVLAALTVADNSLALSKLVPELKGTPLDLALTHAVFVAASRDDPSIGNMITSGYSFHQGVQVCAVLSEIDALNSLMRGPVPGLTLSAGWSKAKGFELDAYLPTPTSLNLGNGITTTPFTLSIETKPVQLTLAAGLKVPVAHSSTPLLFTFSLSTDLLGASATGQMSGWWVDPFGISEKVKVGPNLAVSIDIIFAQFLSTGTPSGFALQGGLMIGNTQAQVALSINDDPMKELLYAEVQSLNLTDVTAFASDIIGISIPEPPKDFLDFEEVKLYICPAGVTIGTTVYPQGFSFQADVILFGKRADIKCVVGTSQISIDGGVDNFTLGPLTVHGTTGPRAIIKCEVGQTVQYLFIDGVISLFDADSTVHVRVDTLPDPKFEFFMQLKFTDLLLYQLNAKLIGTLKFSDLSGADFSFDALFEQHILQYIHDQIILQFDQARRLAEHSIDVAQKAVNDAEANWQAGVDRAQGSLDAQKKIWDEKTETVTIESNKIIDPYNKEIDRVQTAISNAQNDYNLAMTNAENAVEAANRDRARALQDAQHNVDNAERDMVSSIDQAQRDLYQARRAFSDAFGSADQGIESARQKVQSLRNQINDMNNKIDDYKNASWGEFWKKGAIPGLYAALGTLEASKAIADEALQAAEAVTTSSGYIAQKTALDAAQGALLAAEATGQGGLEVAKKSLQVADATSQGVLDSANATLNATKTGAQWVTLQGAKSALQAFKDVNDAAFRAATQALVDLAKSAEFLAYQAGKIALDAANAAKVTLDAGKQALKLAQEAGEDALTIGKWVLDHTMGLLDIRVIQLSGTLHGMVGTGGKMSKPFIAHIEGVLVDQAFVLDGEFDPNKTADFITYIFEDLWKKIKAIT